jgi:SMC interacting uncharacterized protein involved in chromosome segregation
MNSDTDGGNENEYPTLLQQLDDRISKVESDNHAVWEKLDLLFWYLRCDGIGAGRCDQVERRRKEYDSQLALLQNRVQRLRGNMNDAAYYLADGPLETTVNTPQENQNE